MLNCTQPNHLKRAKSTQKLSLILTVLQVFNLTVCEATQVLHQDLVHPPANRSQQIICGSRLHLAISASRDLHLAPQQWAIHVSLTPIPSPNSPTQQSQLFLEAASNSHRTCTFEQNFNPQIASYRTCTQSPNESGQWHTSMAYFKIIQNLNQANGILQNHLELEPIPQTALYRTCTQSPICLKQADGILQIHLEFAPSAHTARKASQ